MYKEKLGIDNLENTLEEIVFRELYNIIQKNKIEFCHCKTCVQDIAAIVLNEVPAMYENSEKNLPNDEKISGYQEVVSQVTEKILEAIEKVVSAPHHNSIQTL